MTGLSWWNLDIVSVIFGLAVDVADGFLFRAGLNKRWERILELREQVVSRMTS